jgi:hypothetical protein
MKVVSPGAARLSRVKEKANHEGAKNTKEARRKRLKFSLCHLRGLCAFVVQFLFFTE